MAQSRLLHPLRVVLAKSTNALHVGIAQLVEPHIKQTQADSIAAEVAAFLKQGGKIQKLGNTPLRGITPPPKRNKVKPFVFARKKVPATVE